MAIGFAGSVVIARLLGPQGYGVVAVSMTIPLTIYGFTDLGLTATIIRYTAMKKYTHAWIAFILRIAAGILASLFVFIFADSFALLVKRPYISGYIKILSLYILGSSVIDSIKALMMGFNKYKYITIIEPIRQGLRAGISILLILIGLRVYGAIAGIAIGVSLSALITILFTYKEIQNIRQYNYSSFSQIFHEIILFALPLYLPQILSTPLYKIIEIYVARFVPNTELGLYNVAVNIALVLNLISSNLETVLFSTLSSIAKNRELLKMSIYKSTLYTTIILISLAFLLAITSKPIIIIIYGKHFSNASIYLSLIASRWVFTATGSMSIPIYFKALGYTKIIAYANILHSIIYITIAIQLIKKYGILGMIISYLISDAISAFYYLFLGITRYKLSIPLKKTLAMIMYFISAYLLLYLMDNKINIFIYLLFIFLSFFIFFYIIIKIILSNNEFNELKYIILSLVPNKIKRLLESTILYRKG